MINQSLLHDIYLSAVWTLLTVEDSRLLPPPTHTHFLYGRGRGENTSRKHTLKEGLRLSTETGN